MICVSSVSHINNTIYNLDNCQAILVDSIDRHENTLTLMGRAVYSSKLNADEKLRKFSISISISIKLWTNTQKAHDKNNC